MNKSYMIGERELEEIRRTEAEDKVLLSGYRKSKDKLIEMGYKASPFHVRYSVAIDGKLKMTGISTFPIQGERCLDETLSIILKRAQREWGTQAETS